MSGTIFERGIGHDFVRLHPRLQSYFGHTGPIRAEGVFDEAGSRIRIGTPVLWVMSKLGLLFPEYGRGVPFTITITPQGPNAVTTVRRLRFPGRVRIMSDRTVWMAGRLVDVHARGLIRVSMRSEVNDDGSLTLAADQARLCLGRSVFRLPPVPVILNQSWDEDEQLYRIDVSIGMPLIGEVFAYRGAFRWHPEA